MWWVWIFSGTTQCGDQVVNYSCVKLLYSLYYCPTTYICTWKLAIDSTASKRESIQHQKTYQVIYNIESVIFFILWVNFLVLFLSHVIFEHCSVFK